MFPDNDNTDPNENDKQDSGGDSAGEVGGDAGEAEPPEVHRPGEPRED